MITNTCLKLATLDGPDGDAGATDDPTNSTATAIRQAPSTPIRSLGMFPPPIEERRQEICPGQTLTERLVLLERRTATASELRRACSARLTARARTGSA